MNENRVSYLDLFGHTVSRLYGKTALVYENRSVTYGELARASDVVAEALLARSDIRGSKIVPISLPRGPETFAALLGVWKAGAAVSFVDPAYPAERTRDIYQQCGVLSADGKTSGFVMDAAWMNTLDPFIRPAPENFIPEQLEREQLALVVFTSGSTGSPKGVMLPHRAVTQCILDSSLSILETDVNLTIISNSFVIVIMELGDLYQGATIDIIPDNIRQDVPALMRYITEHRITGGFLPPVLAAPLLKYMDGRLRFIWTGSDKVTNLGGGKTGLLLGYGCSETAGPVCQFLIDKPYEITPIGKPYAGTRIYLLDGEGKPVPEGAEGEIYVSGDQLALGYLNMPELTAENFVPNPFSDDPHHKVLFRTRDLGRLTADGNYLYIQRSDWMIKIRGYRIEPGEIETAMTKAAPISKAVVVGFESKIPGGSGDQTRLYACYTAKEPVDPKTVREGISSILPDYMIPAFIEQVPALPLNAHGKIDRNKIIPPEIEYFKAAYEDPANEAEKTICDAFGQVLNLDKVGALDDFGLLGGDSLSAAKLLSLLPKELCLSAMDLLSHRTPRSLAVKADANVKTGQFAPHKEGEAGPPSSSAIELTPFQTMFYYEWLLDTVRYDYNIVDDRTFEGEISRENLNSALIRLVNSYFLFNSNVTADKDHLYWKMRDAIPHTAQLLQYFDAPLTPEAIFSHVSKPFDLEKDLLFRYFLIKQSNRQYRFISVVHHIVTDGTKGNELYAEQRNYYNDSLYSGTPDIERQKILYSGLSEKLRKIIDEHRAGINDFWGKHLKNIPPVDLKFLQLPAPLEETKSISPVSAYRFSIDQKEMDRVRVVAQKYGITPYIYGQMVFAVLLHKMTGQDKISFCFPVGITEGADILFGAEINTLIISFSFDAETTIADLAGQSKAYYEGLEASMAKYLPVNEIVKYSDSKDVLKTAFVQTNLRDAKSNFAGVEKETTDDSYYFDNTNALLFEQEKSNNALNFRVRYKNRILDGDLVINFANTFHRLFIDIADDLFDEIGKIN